MQYVRIKKTASLYGCVQQNKSSLSTRKGGLGKSIYPSVDGYEWI